VGQWLGAADRVSDAAGGIEAQAASGTMEAEGDGLPSSFDGNIRYDTQLFNDRLQEWQDFYNYHRLHGALGGQTPYERLPQKTTPAATPE
jgi:hypothetical protein